MKITFSGLLLALTLTLLWLGVGQGKSIPLVIKPTNGQLRASYLETAERWTYDQQGVRNQRVQIGEAISYTDDSVTYLTELRFEGPDNQGRNWLVTAGAGKLRTENNALFLHQGVEMRESSGEGLLTMPFMTIIPSQNRAKTQAPVRLELKDSITTAQGMELDLDSGVARLLNNVETIYEG